MKLKLLFMFSFLVQFLFAQEKTVTGVVSDESNLPLPGANVIVKGTTTGVSTDFDGNYSIKVSNGAVLQFSYVGYVTKEVTVGSSKINVSLDPDNQLDEVVVTALGIKKSEKSLGYAVSKVGGEELSTVKTTNVSSGLSGRVAGVNITSSSNLGGSANVVIRGGSSITGSNQALFVIDGVPVANTNVNTSDASRGAGGYDYGNMASDINPDDIESVSVLKGASATALYGARGANGVVMITTKKGTSKNKIGVTVSSAVTFDQINESTLPDYQNQYGGGSKTTFDQETIDGNTYKVVQYGVDESWGPKFDPNVSVLHWDAFDPSDAANYLKPRAWTAAKNGPAAYFKTGVLKVNNVALEGGSEKGNFRISYTDTEQEGVTPNSQLNRNVAAFNGTLNLTDKLSTTVGVQYINNYAKNRPGTGYDWQNSLSFMASAGMWMQTNVDYKRLKNYLNGDGTMKTWNRGSATNSSPTYWENPYWTAYNNFPEDERNRIIGNWNVNYQINDWLSALGRVTLDHNDFSIEERIAIGSFGTPKFSKYFRKASERNYDLMLNYDKDLSEDFNLNGLVGVGKRQNEVSGLSAETRNGLVIDGLYTIANTRSAEIYKSDWQSAREVQSVYGTASLGYKRMLFLDVSARNDWSSTLPAGDNSFFYPSVSSSFIFSEVLDLDFLSYGKVRANWAQVGNDAPFASIEDTYYNYGNFGDVVRYSPRSTKNNANLKSELTESYELGLDLKLFQNRVALDFSYYNKKAKDLIVPGSVSFGTGRYSEYANIGELENEGFEVGLNVTPVKTDNFTWNTNINWSTNKSMVNALAPGIYSHTLNSNHVAVVARVGQPYGVLIGTDFVRDNKGNRIIDANGHYKQTEDNQVLGDVNPEWRAGITNSFKYKNFTLSALVDIKKGGDLFSLTHYWGRQTGILAETVGLNDLGNDKRLPVADGGGVILKGVKEDGTPNDVRLEAKDSFNSANNPEAGSVFDASYVKLREVSLSYSLPKKLIEKLNVTDLTFSLIGRNLAILHRNVDHIDPEATYGSGNVQGLDIGTMPTTRSLGFSVKLGF